MITIMGFLVSMTVPAVGHISKVQRVKATEQKLEEIKTAIMGNQDVFDDNGLPVVNGYVGDMGALPKLYDSEIDEGTGKWKWSKKEDITIDNMPIDLEKNEIRKELELKEIELINIDNNGRGQPRGLWMNDWGTEKKYLIDHIRDNYKPEVDIWEDKDFDKALKNIWYHENLGEKWKGPYISHPKPMYLDAAENLDPVEDKKLYENRETEGKAIDAWGRNLYFFKDYEILGDESTASLVIVSQGDDQEITLPEELNDPRKTKYSDVADEEANKDNIVVKITPNEWHEAYNKGKEKKTKEQLENIREALVGSLKAVDESGQREIGGYLGDMGEWPDFYELKNNEWSKVDTSDSITNKKHKGQPIGLWKDLLKDNIFDGEHEKLKREMELEFKGFITPEELESKLAQLSKENEELKSQWKKKWKGPHITAPWDQILKDDWGNELRFEIINKVEDEGNMTARSAGIDGVFDTEDDLLVSIDLDEWSNENVVIENGKEIRLNKNDAKKLRKTNQTLEQIRVALLGSKDARDASGRRIVGGYLSDVGEWPTVYVLSKRGWEEAGSNKAGQAINLWTKDKLASDSSNGFRWKGPYLSNTDNKPLVDGWGNDMRFRLKADESEMTITSAGVDGKFHTSADKSEDDIIITIKKSDWMADTVTIKGTIFNTREDDIEVNFNFYANIYGNNQDPQQASKQVPTVKIKEVRSDPKVNEEGVQIIPERTERTIIGEGKANFTIQANNVVLGLRKFTVTGGGLNEEVELFIGEGGTVSPSSDKLNFTIK